MGIMGMSVFPLRPAALGIGFLCLLVGLGVGIGTIARRPPPPHS